jgi:hypothetical protein
MIRYYAKIFFVELEICFEIPKHQVIVLKKVPDAQKFFLSTKTFLKRLIYRIKKLDIFLNI